MSEILFVLKKLVSALIMPPSSPMVLTILGLLLKRRPRLGRALAWGGIIILLLLSLPFTARQLSAAISVKSRLNSDRAHAAQAIVILGGGRRAAPEFGGQSVSTLALERVQYGAKLAKDLGLPVLVTGGSVFGGPPEGQLMARVLRDSFAVEVRWIEDRSRDTRQNAGFSAAILQSAGIRTVLLVTHDVHELRGMREFAAVGIEAVPAPVTTAGDAGNISLVELLPNAGALQVSGIALHEMLGNLVLTSRPRPAN